MWARSSRHWARRADGSGPRARGGRHRTVDTGTVIVDARHLTLGYGTRPVLRDVSLTVHRGEFWCLLGANGEGKTTLLLAMLGLLAPASGTLWMHPAVAARMGFVPQRCDLNPTLRT